MDISAIDIFGKICTARAHTETAISTVPERSDIAISFSNHDFLKQSNEPLGN